MAFFQWIWDGVKSVFALILPVFGKARSFPGLGKGVRWTLHFVLLAAILVGLHFVNQIEAVNRLVKSDYKWVRHEYLPILFVLLYVLAWLAWWLWKLLMPEEEGSVFPDIDAAWGEALNALRKEGLDPTEAPLFLVLGKPVSSEDALFIAAQLPLKVKGEPRTEAPLHVYANADAIYVTCAGASLLGRHVAYLAADPTSDPFPAGMIGEDGMSEDDAFKTMAAGDAKGYTKDVQAVLRKAQEQGRDLSELERQEIRRLMGQDRLEQARQIRKSRPSLLKNTVEADELSARLQHLCRLISRDRRPFCPLNGIMLLVPFAGADSDDDANQTSEVCRRDLTTVRNTLKVNCPILSLVVDLEMAPGFQDFLTRISEKDRRRRVGQRFPLNPDVDEEGLQQMVDSGVHWLCNSMFAGWVYKLFRVEESEQDTVEDITTSNAQLYQLLWQLVERQKRLSRILTRGLLGNHSGPPLFGGCYLGGTGKNAGNEQAFVAGVFRRLIDEQNFVSWTDEALAEEANFQKWTTRGYAILVGAVLTLAAVVAFFWFR